MHKLIGKSNIRCQAVTAYPPSLCPPANSQCQHLSGYYHEEKYYCKTHAGSIALDILCDKPSKIEQDINQLSNRISKLEKERQ